jgi:hypothetical protein
MYKGKVHGKGKYTFKNGDVYDGEWRNQLQNGYGVFTTKGETYKGTWIDGIKVGEFLKIDKAGKQSKMNY